MTGPGIGGGAGAVFQSNRAASNPFQSTAGAAAGLIGQPGSTNRGMCTITYAGQVFRFRTNPNDIWWSYELITNVDETYGGRVIQLLGTRLGDLQVTVEAGEGGWDYVKKTADFLRQMMIDQRGGPTGTFEYTTRNWKLKVYAMSIPFQDQVEATTRPMTLQFKIQEDVNKVVTTASMAKALTDLQDGIYRPGQNIHNQYNDADSDGTPLGAGVGPTGYKASGIGNSVNSSPQGDNPGGLSPFGAIPFLPSIPGLGWLSGGG